MAARSFQELLVTNFGLSPSGYTGSAGTGGDVTGYSGSSGGAAIGGNLFVSGDLTISSTGFIGLPIGTTAQRPASPANGAMRINTSTNYLEVYYNGGWSNLSFIGAIIASGGTITTSGGYKYHTFTTSGSFVVSQIGNISTVEVLIVAGGGGGGGSSGVSIAGGGGGAGGAITATFSVATQSYSIVIGAGAATVAAGFNQGGTGSNTTAFGYTALGGGGGGTWEKSGTSGGSGGGAGENDQGLGPGAGTAGQGFSGGDDVGYSQSVSAAGGGGGAGGVGGNASGGDTIGGNGGIGVNWLSLGNFYAGGGGGAGSTTPGSAGQGGGGQGAGPATGSGVAGTTNTGGGGGGALTNGSEAAQSGAAGGSGIVIIRYAV